VEGLTPASADDLPALGELVADEAFWRYPTGTPGRDAVAHLRVWRAADPGHGHIAVVTETGAEGAVTKSAASIWGELTRGFGLSLVLLEHCPAAATGESLESLDLVALGADGQPHWSRVWPVDEDHPRHAGLAAWMASHGAQILYS
jgi:hypothetical protein